MPIDLLEAIRSRRVTRFFTDKPVPDDLLWKILEAARWAPTGGNRRQLRFICINDPEAIHQLKLVTPGLGGIPSVIIIVAIDWKLARYTVLNDTSRTTYIDIGTATENMLLAAHALGIGAGPVTSFAPEAIQVLLNFPDELTPELFVCLGYPHPEPKRGPIKSTKRTIRLEDLVQWGPFPTYDTKSKTQ